MSQLKVETPKGELKYRLPDIAEGYDFLCFMDGIKTGEDVLRAKGKIVKNMGHLLEYKELGYETYQDVLDDKEHMRAPLAEISRAIWDDVVGLFEKKI